MGSKTLRTRALSSASEQRKSKREGLAGSPSAPTRHNVNFTAPGSRAARRQCSTYVSRANRSSVIVEMPVDAHRIRKKWMTGNSRGQRAFGAP